MGGVVSFRCKVCGEPMGYDVHGKCGNRGVRLPEELDASPADTCATSRAWIAEPKLGDRVLTVKAEPGVTVVVEGDTPPTFVRSSSSSEAAADTEKPPAPVYEVRPWLGGTETVEGEELIAHVSADVVEPKTELVDDARARAFSDRVDKLVETFHVRDSLEGAMVVQALLGHACIYGRAMGLTEDTIRRWLAETFETMNEDAGDAGPPGAN